MHAKNRYDEMTDRYRRVARAAKGLRLVIDVSILSIEAVTPLAVGVGLASLGVPPFWAFVLAVAVGILLLCPYVLRGHHGSWSGRALFLTVLAGIGYAMLYALDVAATPATVADTSREEIVRVTASVTGSATVALLAVLLVHILRRQRRNVVGWFMPRSPREEIVCEFVQILTLLTQMGQTNDGDCRKLLVIEKLDRLQYLFRTGAVFAALPASAAAKRKVRARCSRIGLELRDYQDGVAHDGLNGQNALHDHVARLAAKVLAEFDDHDTEKKRLAWRERIRATTIWIVRVITAGLIIIGALLLMRKLGFTDGIVMTILVFALVITVVVPLVKKVAPDASETSWADHLPTLLHDLIRGRNSAAGGDDPSAAGDSQAADEEAGADRSASGPG